MPRLGRAGAWVPAQHDGIFIANVVSIGAKDREPGRSIEVYGEYGLGRGWAVVLAPSVSQGVRTDRGTWAADEVLVGLRRHVLQRESLAVSLQIGAFSTPSSAVAGQRDQGNELRLALGASFADAGWVNGEIAGRTCGSARAGTRFDATAGWHLPQNQLLIVKAFGDGDGCTRQIVRGQISYVRPISPQMSVEFGFRSTIAAPDAARSQGVVIGLWRRF